MIEQLLDGVQPRIIQGVQEDGGLHLSRRRVDDWALVNGGVIHLKDDALFSCGWVVANRIQCLLVDELLKDDCISAAFDDFHRYYFVNRNRYEQ